MAARPAGVLRDRPEHLRNRQRRLVHHKQHGQPLLLVPGLRRAGAQGPGRAACAPDADRRHQRGVPPALPDQLPHELPQVQRLVARRVPGLAPLRLLALHPQPGGHDVQRTLARLHGRRPDEPTSRGAVAVVLHVRRTR